MRLVDMHGILEGLPNQIEIKKILSNFEFKGFDNSKKKLPPVGLDLMLQIITGL